MAEEKEQKKFMDGKKLIDITPEDLMIESLNNTSELKDLDAVSEKYDMIHRVLLLNDIDEAVSNAIAHLIRFWNKTDEGVPIKDREPIKIYIDSNGGSLTGALLIADSIKLSKTPVFTINMGTAYSGGLLVFICGHRRWAYPSSSFLFHEGSTNLGAIDAGKFKNYSSYYEKLIDKMKKYILSCTKVTEELYKEKSRDDWWFFVDEALEYGFADEIIEEFI